MKILIASTPATGHLNPLLAIGHTLIAEGHELALLSGSVLRGRIEAIGAKFHALPDGADYDLRDFDSVAPELKTMAPGLDWLRVALERVFVDTLPAQHEGLQQVLRAFPADIVIGDDMFFGVLPMLLGPRSKRPPVALCGTSFLHWRREDSAPHFVGLPPATTKQQVDDYAAIAREHDRVIYQPVADRLNRRLQKLGVGPLSMQLFESVVDLADAYLQLTVPSFEFPRDMPPSVRFVGTPPIIPNQVAPPSWAHELDGSRKVVLVTQGTLANHNFGLLIGPTLAALANEPDLLVVATAGGRPVEAIPGPIPGNARLAQYLPFEWMLPKADVLVTNGGYGSVNQALSFGVPLVAAGLTEDKADVNARIGWSGAGINLATNEPTPQALREAVRTVLDKPDHRARAKRMADEFGGIDTRSEILRIVGQLAHRATEAALPPRRANAVGALQPQLDRPVSKSRVRSR
ncbi:glycosyltransferase [Bradyrhizobium erythrophlei]|uniref:Glycosyltransferase, MGT family n=1 Tax=Bradyrhizobium erythrophlei TaxID=1437360 RepID=A0A1M5HY92_9BRAD|nr:nucleotide disphospho-sugar-binding domain-containing protein [Bradyrhizobium erythrophlei]SHG20991.1 glycosyltransferase, MGT family [Bradyrhizobium erythrophlei]